MRLSFRGGFHSTNGLAVGTLLIPLFSIQILYLGVRNLDAVYICAIAATSLCIIVPFCLCFAISSTVHFPVTALGLIQISGAYIATVIGRKLFSD
jgi:hypothetical protein